MPIPNPAMVHVPIPGPDSPIAGLTQSARLAASAPRIVEGPNGPALFVPDISGAKNAEAAQLAAPGDYAPGERPDLAHERCEFPECGAVAQNRLYVAANRHLSINAKGEIKRGPRVRIPEEQAAIVGPLSLQGAVHAGSQVPKSWLALCQRHYRLDYVILPLPKRKIYTSGPYTSLGAERRAQTVERQTGERVRVFERRDAEGMMRWHVNGDTPDVPGWQGTMTPEPEESK